MCILKAVGGRKVGGGKEAGACVGPSWRPNAGWVLTLCPSFSHQLLWVVGGPDLSSPVTAMVSCEALCVNLSGPQFPLRERR